MTFLDKKLVVTTLSAIALAFVPLSASAQLLPSITTLEAKQTSPESVRLEAFVVPVAGESVNVWFEYSTRNGLVERTNPTVVSFPTTVSIQVLDLKNSTQYFVQAVAQNTRGFVYGEVEDFIFSSSSFTLPRATTRNVTNIRDTSVTLEGFIDPRDGEDTEFWFEWGLTENLGLKTTVVKHFGSASKVRAILTGLTRGEIYHYRVVVKNSLGLNRGHIRDFIAGKESILPSERPDSSTFAASPTMVVDTKLLTTTGNTTAKVGGQVLTGSKVSTTAWFEWGETEALGNETVHRDIGVGYPFNDYTETIEGLAPSKTYYYRAVAQNANGFDEGLIQTFQTSGSGAVAANGNTNGGAEYENGLIQVDDEGNIISWFGGKRTDGPKPGDEGRNGGDQRAAAFNGDGNGIFPDTVFGWIFLLLLIVLLVGYSHYFYGKYQKQKEEEKRKKELAEKEQG